MTGNANLHEEARWDRLATAHKRDREEAPGEDGVHDATKFRKAAVEQVHLMLWLDTA